MSDLLVPVNYRGMSSWAQHQRRIPRSTEPGTDLYCPIGTPVYAPDTGDVWGYGTSIEPATGRWVGINFDNGMSFRALHLSRVLATGGRVARGDLIGYSGATGYGENDWSWNPDTGGAHTHVTLWPTWDHRYGYDGNGNPFTIDFMAHTSGSVSSTEPSPITERADDMRAVILAGNKDSGIIIQAATPPYSLPESIFVALCMAYDLTAVTLPQWQYDTVVREQWTAYNVGQQFANTGVDPASVQAIADQTAVEFGRKLD